MILRLIILIFTLIAFAFVVVSFIKLEIYGDDREGIYWLVMATLPIIINMMILLVVKGIQMQSKTAGKK